MTVDALFNLIQSPHYDNQKQRYFLYKEAASLLVDMAVQLKPGYDVRIITGLKSLIQGASGRRKRALSESIGALPIRISGPKIHPKKKVATGELDFNCVLQFFNHPVLEHFSWHGRTLRVKAGRNRIGCIKFARSASDIERIETEVQWLCYLAAERVVSDAQFHIPSALVMGGNCVFSLVNMPSCLKKNPVAQRPAIIFMTIDDYYHYPNEGLTPLQSKSALLSIFSKNAFLLGRMAGQGIFHTAVIPLFHNRVQHERRPDRGVYLWEHGGRLDRWLESCRYPNFSLSGVRDFEHLESASNSRRLRHFIGEHILGLILVMGSVFRQAAPDKIGYDESGRPYDLRHLFDESFFSQMLHVVMQKYYEGVTGSEFNEAALLPCKDLVRSLINVMGIDRHMEEILRARDQESMDHDRFTAFLQSRGYPLSAIENVSKARKDILLLTGPHLGGFNQPISVPELIDFLFGFSCLCVADRYLHENGLKGAWI